MLLSSPLIRAQLPSQLLRVGEPGRTTVVQLGINARQAIEVARTLYPRHTGRRAMAVQKMRSELGTSEHDVPSFFLAKTPVTNARYLRFVEQRRAMGKPVRFPFHWWAQGQKQDLEARRADFTKKYAEHKNPALHCWLAQWRELPYAIPEGQEQWPVVFVSFEDAIEYASHYGMNLPTELQWTMAARGSQGRERTFVCGNQLPQTLLAQLGLADPSDRSHLLPVGKMGHLARGPFGHEDMFGQVWELVFPLGYRPQNKETDYQAQSAILQAMPIAKRIGPTVGFTSDKAIAKGGSFYSLLQENWMELRINTRAAVHEQDVLSGLGFRLAKTERPGFDLARLRLLRTRPITLAGLHSLEFLRQVGVEKYTLSADGQHADRYDGLSFVPVRSLTLSTRGTKSRFLTKSQTQPETLGALVVTMPLTKPKLAPGTYTIEYRGAGVPRNLRTALTQGIRVLQRKGRDSGTWRETVQRFGYTDADIRTQPLAKLLAHVYSGGGSKRLAIPSATDVLIFRAPDGTAVATQSVQKFEVRSTTSRIENVLHRKGATIAITAYIPVHARAASRSRGKKWTFRFAIETANIW